MGACSIRAPSARCFFRAFGLPILSCRKRRSSGSSRSPRPLQGAVPQLTQAIVTAFITEGHFARHIQRMRKLYAERREATAAGLESVLGKHMRIDSQPGGMHLILRLQGRRSDRRLVARMREEGLYAEALTDWTMDRDGASALLAQFHEYRLSAHRRDSRKADLEADMTCGRSLYGRPRWQQNHGLVRNTDHGPSDIGQDASRKGQSGTLA